MYRGFEKDVLSGMVFGSFFSAVFYYLVSYALINLTQDNPSAKEIFIAFLSLIALKIFISALSHLRKVIYLRFIHTKNIVDMIIKTAQHIGLPPPPKSEANFEYILKVSNNEDIDTDTRLMALDLYNSILLPSQNQMWPVKSIVRAAGDRAIFEYSK